MKDEQLLAAVRQVDPVVSDALTAREDTVLARVLARALAERREPHVVRLPARKRVMLAASVVAFGVLSAGIAVGATRWLGGEPAPQPVVADFQSYTPQLGFHPDPRSAVLVAEDGTVSLYAATNRESTYCLVLSAPWKRPETLDGGTCVPAAVASGRLSAGVLGASASTRDGYATMVVGGRVKGAAARRIKFTAPDGELVERPIGSSGFFVAQLRVHLPPCAGGDWSPSFTALDGNGHEIVQSTITLMQARQGGQVCLFSFLRSQ